MRILVAIGGGSQTDTMLRLGNVLQQAVGGVMTLLTVIRHESERPQAEAILARARTFFGPSAAKLHTRIRCGGTAEEIIDEIVEGKYEMVMIGDPIHRGIGWRKMATTAARILTQMACPVLIAQHDRPELRRLLVCEGTGRDPSVLSRLIARFEPLLSQINELTVLHVMSQIAAAPGVPGWELRADAGELMARHTPEGIFLEGDLAQLKKFNIRPQAKIRHGLVVHEILEEARAGEYDLIVVGSHRPKGWERFLLDDLTDDIITHADRPLLII